MAASRLWTSRLLTSPPIVLLPVTSVLGSNETIQRYGTTLEDMRTELKLLLVMEKEIWVMSRIISKYENSGRLMKWFGQCKKIYKSCVRLLQLKLQDLAVSLLPDIDQSHIAGSNPDRWPSSQMLEYFLTRLLGFASLCLYIWSNGYNTNELLLQNMERRILFHRHYCKLGMVSRLQLISQHLVEKCCKWYTALYPWIQCLPKLNHSWLPEGVSLPISVEEALGSHLIEMRNVISQRDMEVEERSKSTLDNIFGIRSDDTLLPKLVIQENDNLSKNTVQHNNEREDVKCIDMSLDDIFTGLVAKQEQQESETKRDHEKKTKHERLTEDSLPSVNDKETAKKMHSTNHQSEDVGVPISQDDITAKIKKKKKKKRLKQMRLENVLDVGDHNIKKRRRLELTDMQTTLQVESMFTEGIQEATVLVQEAESGGGQEETRQEKSKKKKKKKKEKSLSGDVVSIDSLPILQPWMSTQREKKTANGYDGQSSDFTHDKQTLNTKNESLQDESYVQTNERTLSKGKKKKKKKSRIVSSNIRHEEDIAPISKYVVDTAIEDIQNNTSIWGAENHSMKRKKKHKTKKEL